jgi:predicted nucleic acid-binding protein
MSLVKMPIKFLDLQRRIEVKIVVDSYAWIEIFAGTNKGRTATKIMNDAEELYTPDVVLAEIARKYKREGFDRRVVEQRLDSIADASQVIPIDRNVALESASAFLDLRQEAKRKGLAEPGLFDAIILGTTRAISGKVLTGDPHFEDLKETLWL